MSKVSVSEETAFFNIKNEKSEETIKLYGQKRRQSERAAKLSEKRAEFSEAHPLVCFLFIAAVLTVSMLSYNPVLVGTSFVMSSLCVTVLCGVKRCLRNFLIGVPVCLFTAVIQPIFSGAGETVLYYINDNPVSAESYVFGIVAGLLLVNVIQWCSCLGALLDSDRMMYILGNTAPTLGLTFSMILRFIPLLGQRYRQIHDAQLGMGRQKKSRLRLFAREVSILISWSLDSSIETSASMEARGYGKGKRTNYHNYRLKYADIAAIFYIVLLAAFIIAGIITGKADIYYMPRIVFTGNAAITAVMAIAFIMLAAAPLAYEIRGAVKWHYLNSKI